jgi:hypothetical protein
MRLTGRPSYKLGPEAKKPAVAAESQIQRLDFAAKRPSTTEYLTA